MISTSSLSVLAEAEETKKTLVTKKIEPNVFKINYFINPPKKIYLKYNYKLKIKTNYLNL